MIEFTIKTLDSKDHRFSVDDEITVQQLKEKVLEQMGVEIGLQRLIFCGRVLQDEKKLAEYGVHGKVIHMVQRAPPCVEAQMSALRDRERERERENAFTNLGTTVTSEPIGMSPAHLNHITQQLHVRRLMALASTTHGIEIEEQPGPHLSATASRLEFLRRLITEIRTNLDALKTSESDEPRSFATDDPLESTSAGGSSSRPEEIDHGLEASRLGRGRRIRSMRSNYHTPPRDFGQLVEELHELENEFAPFRDIYINILREASDPEVNLSEGVLQRRQRTADLCAELYHSLAHAYHAVSDVGLLMAHGNSRLTSDALMRQPLPVHAHINVVQASPMRRPPSAAAAGAPRPAPREEPEPQTSSAPAGRNAAQPTVNINIQPDPVTYQVEIEAAVPIPINIETFMNGTSTSQAGPPGASPQQQSDAAPDQDALNERRQVMLEFEHMLRGLGQTGGLGGVEVVMSMEEIPQVVGGANNNNSAPAAGSQPIEGGGNQPRTLPQSQMYLAQTADLLHNIVASVFRQGLVPGMEGVLHAQVQQVQGPTQTQRQGQGPSPAQPQTQSQAPNQTQTQAPSQENQTNTEQNANANSANANQRRQQARNRGQRAHPQTVSIFNLVYDRFLPCDSLHARRQLQRRREDSMQAGGPCLHDPSSTRIQNNVETLFERFDMHAIDEESLMIAAIVTLREATSFSFGRTLDPDELLPLRQRLQVYMRDLMQGEEYEVGDQEQLADLIFERHADFINRIATITPMRRNVDVIASMKAVFIRFLNEAMLVLDMQDNDLFSRRFRIIFPRLFYELCGVISYCCLEGVEGLRKIYRSFLTDLIQNVNEPVRDLLHSLAMENLNAAIARVERNKIHYPQFIRRRDQASCSQSRSPRPTGIRQPRYLETLRTIDSESSTESPKPKSSDELDATVTSDDIFDSDNSELVVKEPEETRATQSRTDRSPSPIAIRQSRYLNSSESTKPKSSEELDDTDGIFDSENSEIHFNEQEETRARALVPYEDSTTMELSPQADAMQTSPPSSVVSVELPEGNEPVAYSTPVGSPPPHNRTRANEDASSARNASDDVAAEPRGGDSAAHDSGRVRTDAPQSGSDSSAEQGALPDYDEDEGDLDWPDDTDEVVGGLYDPRGRVSAVHNRGTFRMELLRFPVPGHSVEAHAAPSAAPRPPLEPVGLEELQPVRGDSLRGRFRQETPRPAVEGQSSGSASAPLAPLVPFGPPNGLVTGRTDQNGRVSSMGHTHSRGRLRPNRQPRPGSTDTANSTDDLIFVPPGHIAQHWGEGWVPAFTRDLQRQRAADPDEPFSDAYLSGMPPKKRRCVRQARPPTTLNAFITESVREAAAPAGAAQQEELRVTLRGHVRSIARVRAAASRDYEPRRFAATARFLNQPRTNARSSPENTSSSD